MMRSRSSACGAPGACRSPRPWWRRASSERLIRFDMAAARIAATIRPATPIGISRTMNVGKILSADANVVRVQSVKDV